MAADGSHLDRLSGGESILGLKLVRTEARSTVWRCTSSQGVLWFKENSSTNPAEGAIHHVLAGLAPEYVTPPVAWDRSRGWILTRDGGTTMMDRKPETRGIDPSGVSELVRDYAQLQRATIDHRSALLDAGLPEPSPAGVGLMLTDLAVEMAEADPQDPRHIDEVEFQRLRDAVAGIEQAAHDLLDGPVPLAFDHNDLFPRNVFVPEATGAYRFFDFGESVWAHPFGSLVMLQWELAHQLKIDLGDKGALDLRHPPISGVFDAYLEQWRDYADRLTLRRLTAATLQIAPLYRTWVWMGVLRNTPTALAAHGKTPRAWIFDVERPVML